MAAFRFRCRDKIEPNLQSQMYVERTPSYWSPASSGTDNLPQVGAPSTQSDKFLQFSARKQSLYIQHFIFSPADGY